VEKGDLESGRTKDLPALGGGGHSGRGWSSLFYVIERGTVLRRKSGGLTRNDNPTFFSIQERGRRGWGDLTDLLTRLETEKRLEGGGGGGDIGGRKLLLKETAFREEGGSLRRPKKVISN